MAKPPVAVISGATRGLGRAVALQLAARGWHIVALARRPGPLEELDDEIARAGGSATLVPMDFTANLDLCDALGAELHQKFGKIDGLVLAAGHLGLLTPLSHLDPIQMQKAMRVNAIAPYRLVRALDPLLGASSTVAAIGCELGSDTLAYWGHYRASKAALMAMMESYRAEVASRNIRVMCFDPGVMDTHLYREAFPGALPGSLPTLTVLWPRC